MNTGDVKNPLSPQSEQAIKQYIESKSKSSGRDYNQIKLVIDKKSGEYKALNWGTMSASEKAAVIFDTNIKFTSTKKSMDIIAPLMANAIKEKQEQKKMDKCQKFCDQLNNMKEYQANTNKIKDQEQMGDALKSTLKNAPDDVKEFLYDLILESKDFQIDYALKAALQTEEGKAGKIDAIIANVAARVDLRELFKKT